MICSARSIASRCVTTRTLNNKRTAVRTISSSSSGMNLFTRDEYGLFIGGKQVPSSTSSSRMEVENPATTESLAWIAVATREDVERAVESSRVAFATGAWSRASSLDRSRVLHDIASALRTRIPEFAEKESLQTGRPIREMRAQLTRLPGLAVGTRGCVRLSSSVKQC